MATENRITFRVRYKETDRMESVYHANYLVYFEMGRTEFMREHGICYREMEKEGFGMVVVEARANFRSPARYDDEITVRTALPAHNRISLKFAYSIHLGENTSGPLLCDGTTLLAFIGPNRRPTRIPEKWLTIIERVSHGEILKRNKNRAQ